jgi:hypothetical protein
MVRLGVGQVLGTLTKEPLIDRRLCTRIHRSRRNPRAPALAPNLTNGQWIIVAPRGELKRRPQHL